MSGRAALDGVRQDQVHQLDDRRLFRPFCQRLDIELFVLFQNFQVGALRLLQVLHHLLQLER